MSLLFSFFGRIGRGGFWLGVLLSFIISGVIIGVAAALVPWGEVILKGPDGQPLTGPDGTMQLDWSSTKMMPAYIGYGLAMLLSLWNGFAVAVKRAHDRGNSGWWTLLMFIPLVGAVWWLVALGILEGQDGANQYGPDPRAAKA